MKRTDNNPADDYVPKHTVPHWDNPFRVLGGYVMSRTPYAKELIARLGQDRFIVTGQATYARDAEAVAMWILAYDAIEANDSVSQFDFDADGWFDA